MPAPKPCSKVPDHTRAPTNYLHKKIHPNGKLSRHHSLAKGKSCSIWSCSTQKLICSNHSHSCQPEGQSSPLMCQQQSRFKHDRTVYTTYTKNTLEHPAQVTRETVSLSPTGCLLYKVTLPRLRGIANLPDTKKQTQGIGQNQETKKRVPRKQGKKKTEEELNEMETGNIPDT